MAKVNMENRERWLARLFRRLRGYFFTGMVVAMPVVITIYLVNWFIDFVDRQVLPIFPEAASSQFAVPGFGLIISAISLVILGWFAANVFGQTLIGFGERIVNRMPVVSAIYSALKQIFETVLSNRSSNFREVGLIEYPRPGVHALVFITTEVGGEIRHKIRGQRKREKTIAVFLPTTPNPTSGFLLFLPETQVKKLSMSVEEAAKMVISGGLLEPRFSEIKKLPAPKKKTKKVVKKTKST